jgi:hypothetical protein
MFPISFHFYTPRHPLRPHLFLALKQLVLLTRANGRDGSRGGVEQPQLQGGAIDKVGRLRARVKHPTDTTTKCKQRAATRDTTRTVPQGDADDAQRQHEDQYTDK